MSIDFKTELNSLVKKDFDDCIVNTYNRIVDIIQNEIQDGESKISTKLVVGYNPFTSYCDISIGDALSNSVDYWEKNSENGKSLKSLAKQVEGYDLYYRDSSFTPYFFAFRGFLGLSKTGKLFADSLQSMAAKENIVLKNFKPSNAINIPTLIEFTCQYKVSKEGVVPKKYKTPNMNNAIEKTEKNIRDFLKGLSLRDVRFKRLDALDIYLFSLLYNGKEYKTQILVECDAKEITLTESINMGNYHIEQEDKILNLCEKYNSGTDDSDFNLNCYTDKTLCFAKRVRIDFNQKNYEDILNKNLSSINGLVNDRVFKLCCDYVD